MGTGAVNSTKHRASCSWSLTVAFVATVVFPALVHAEPIFTWIDGIRGSVVRSSDAGDTSLASGLTTPTDLVPTGCSYLIVERKAGLLSSLDGQATAAPLTPVRSLGAGVRSLGAFGPAVFWGTSGAVRSGSSSTDGSADRTLVSGGVVMPNGIAVDGAAKKVYWIEGGRAYVTGATNDIRRANLDGSNVEVVSPVGKSATALFLNPYTDYMYWAENTSPPSILRAKKDGSGRTTVTSSNLRYVYRLAIGPDALYALDLEGTIKSINLQTGSVSVVRSGISLGAGLTVTADFDNDGALDDCHDGCPTDPLKTAPGQCGCGITDVDGDADGTPDCHDGCVADPAKSEPGGCGCGVADKDTDGDGTLDCKDMCSLDPNKSQPGICGCSVPDTDTDSDGAPDCKDRCPADPAKVARGECGCGVPDSDVDSDGVLDCKEQCPADPLKTTPGQCGCGQPETDTDGDGTADCRDLCPINPDKVAPGPCTCAGYELRSREGAELCSAYRPWAASLVPKQSTAWRTANCVVRVEMEPLSHADEDVEYEVQLVSGSGRVVTARTTTSIAARLTAPKPGTYTVRYRALIRVGRSAYRSRWAPDRSFVFNTAQCNPKRNVRSQTKHH